MELEQKKSGITGSKGSSIQTILYQSRGKDCGDMQRDVSS